MQNLKKLNATNTVYVLQLQGTGDEELAYENAGVYTSYALAEAVLQNYNEEYAVNFTVYSIGDNARISTVTLNT
jgi:hypothetical protein